MVAKVPDEAAPLPGAPAASGLPTRERILVEAASLFRVRGFAATSMRSIAKATGLTQGALYWHFPSKEEILYSILLGLSQDWDRALDTIPMDSPPREKLKLLVRGQLSWEFQLADAGRALLAVHGPNQLKQFLGDEQRAFISSRQLAHFQVIVDTLAAGVEDGSFRSFDPYLIGHAIYEMCSGPPTWQDAGGLPELALLLDVYEDLVMRMVRREN